jgi:hypothetical protein
MKKLFLIAATLFAGQLSAQWESKKVDNGFDPPYHLASCFDTKSNFLKLENFGEGKIALILYTGYFCTEQPFVELSFKMDTGWSKYSGNAIMRTTDKKKIIITTDIDNLFSDEFRKSSILKIRVDDDHCGKTIYQFNMAGSTNAINYVLKSPN